MRLNDVDFLELEREACSRSLLAFVQRAWHVLEPAQPYIYGWHLKAICDHLEAITAGQITRLLINVPPGTMKSMSAAVFWPAWEWGPKGLAHKRFIGASHEGGLATRDNMKMRRLITSEWYQTLWPTDLTNDQNEKTYFENSKTGWRQSCPVGSMTGRRGDTVLWDDPHSVEDAHSIVALESANRIFRETLPTRLNNPDKSAIVVLMQRLNQKDISGEIIGGDLGYDHLCLPMEYEGPRKATSIGFVDPRKKVGDLLFPERFPRAVVERDKKIMGDYAVAGQFQQRPAPAGGGIIKTDKFRLWPNTKEIPDLFFVLVSLDTAFTERTTGDPTACTVWGVFEHDKKRHVLLLDAWSDHLSYPDLLERVIADWGARYGGVKDNQMKPSRKPDAILCEAKGSGISLIQSLRLANIPVIPYNPGRADKITRAHLLALSLESDNWWVLESAKELGKPRTWVRPFLTDLEQFPNGEHDDFTDTASQAAIYLRDTRQLESVAAPADEPEDMDYELRKRQAVNPYG